MFAAVEAALAFVGVLPPPAAGADVLAGGDGTCTGLTPYAGVALLVHPVKRHIVGFDVVNDLGLTPQHERIEFDYVIGGVVFCGKGDCPLFHISTFQII